MSKIKAVIFDVGGVIIPQPQKAISSYAKAVGLSNKFLPELFLEGVPNNAFCKLERGEFTLSEFYAHFDLEAKKKAKRELLDLPKSFNVQSLFQAMHGNLQSLNHKPFINADMLSAATILRKNGILTCVLTNNWIDENNLIPISSFMSILKNYFNFVIESCNIGVRKPETRIYQLACQKLGVHPQECVFLDDIGKNLKAASKLGVVGIKVKDPKEALKELEILTDIKLLDCNSTLLFPAPCTPSTVVHGYVKVKPNVTIHFVESGEGPAILLLHGFPDFWYGWRHQIPALANAGYRAIALDQRGYGESSSPHGIDEYSHEELSTDVISLMDKLGIRVATVVGHDWGGSLAWVLALKFPNRFRGVCGVNTPFYKINPVQNPLVSMKKNPGVFDYQLYFQEPGLAEKELEHDIERSLSIFLQGYDSISPGSILTSMTSSVRKRGGVLVGFPEKMHLSSFITPFDMKVYVNAFKKQGFRGPLNWYRNYENNWKWLQPVAHRKLTLPALMVTAEDDMVLKPKYSYGMEERVLNLKRLHIDKCCHWTMQEQPFKLNDGLIKWLDSTHIGSKVAKL